MALTKGQWQEVRVAFGPVEAVRVEPTRDQVVAKLGQYGYRVVEDGEAVIVIDPNADTLRGTKGTATRYGSPRAAVNALLKNNEKV